jgi:hypothetical protein
MMKILMLDLLYRSWLNSKFALMLDEDHNEKFVGLTHSESIFYAKMSNLPCPSFDQWDVDVLTLFLDLHEKHQLTLAFQIAARSFMAKR